MTQDLTPAERETLLALSAAHTTFVLSFDPSAAVFRSLEGKGYAISERAFYATRYRITRAGLVALAALAAQPEPAADTIDPTAWAALLTASGAFSETPGTLSIRRKGDGQWVVTIRPTHYWGPAVGIHADINTAIRVAVAQAEGREDAP